jgi:hypothetical protein
MKLSPQEQGRRSKNKGKAGEKLALTVMRSLGFKNLQQIGTPVRLIPPSGKQQRRDFFRRIIWGEKVRGDIWGIESETGKSVLVEVKTYDGDRLVFSALDPHQVEALNSQVSCNGLAFLVWVSFNGIFVLEWPIPGFEPRTSLSLEKAERLCLL